MAIPADSPRRLERDPTLADLATQRLLPALATAMLGFAGWYVWSSRPVTEDRPPPILPAANPYLDGVAAAGIVEARTENISIGSATAGVVVEVMVGVGDTVTAGAPLFRLDDRDLQGQRLVAEAAVAEARSLLVRLEAQPRQEEIPLRMAAVAEAEAAVVREADALERTEETFARKAISEQELISRREGLAAARAQRARAGADLDLLKAGAWQYDRDVAEAAVTREEAALARTRIDIDRLVVRALIPGRVLKVNVRPGEFVGAPPNQPLIVLGDVEQLHIRVDIDEYDIPRFQPDRTATAFPRGNLQERYPLSFVRVEPYVIPKKSLTGDTTERVDTRVLQVIFLAETSDRPPLFVGQQMEVFIDAAR